VADFSLDKHIGGIRLTFALIFAALGVYMTYGYFYMLADGAPAEELMIALAFAFTFYGIAALVFIFAFLNRLRLEILHKNGAVHFMIRRYKTQPAKSYNMTEIDEFQRLLHSLMESKNTQK
jgi:hypothetical protein